MLTATQHLVCTAHRPGGAAAFDPAWRLETVMALARGITAGWAFDRLPILADALEEAGCDDPVVLRHCRECRQHTAHCWVLGDLFDRQPVPEPRRLTEEQVRREVEFITGRRLEPADPPIDGFRLAFGVPRPWVLAIVGAGLLLTLCPSLRPRPTPLPTPTPGQFNRR